MSLARRVANAFGRRCQDGIVRKELFCLPSPKHIMRALCFERSNFDKTGCYVWCFFMLPACGEEDINLSNGFRFRRDGNDGIWRADESDVSRLLQEFRTTGERFFGQVGSLEGIAQYLRQKGPLSILTLRQQEMLFYCCLLQHKYQDGLQVSDHLLQGLDRAIETNSFGARAEGCVMDWRVDLRNRVNETSCLLRDGKWDAVGRTLLENEARTYRNLSWPVACIDKD